MKTETSNINEFHLFAGIGGGIYGGLLLGHKCCAGVEINNFCKTVLRQRQKDGWLESFPIYDDVTTIDGTKFKGNFDVLCGGFPCQAFSTAAHGKNIAEKNLWDYMLKFIKDSEAPVVFGENVVLRAIIHARVDLEKIGYKVAYCRLSCKDIGADHQRNRFWVLAVKDENVFKKIATNILNLPKFHTCWDKEPIDEYTVKVEHRREQLTGIGNAQSPIVAALAFRILVKRQIEKDYKSLTVSKEELALYYESKESWIKQKYGDIGGLHTPTTMANYHCKSMMKHKSCVNFVKVFGTPQPLNGEYLMGMPIGMTSPLPVNKSFLKSWTYQISSK